MLRTASGSDPVPSLLEVLLQNTPRHPPGLSAGPSGSAPCTHQRHSRRATASRLATGRPPVAPVRMEPAPSTPPCEHHSGPMTSPLTFPAQGGPLRPSVLGWRSPSGACTLGSLHGNVCELVLSFTPGLTGMFRCPRGLSRGNCPLCCPECKAGTWSWTRLRNTPGPRCWRPPPAGSLPGNATSSASPLLRVHLDAGCQGSTPAPPRVTVTVGLARAGCSAQHLWFTDGCIMAFPENRQNGVPAEAVWGARALHFSGHPVVQVGPICPSWHLECPARQDTVRRVPPGFLLMACDGRLSPELTWESPSDIAESQHQPYAHL